MQTSTGPEKTKGNFWTTLPGVLTGIAAIVTATAALVGGLAQAGYFSHRAPATQTTSSAKETDGASQPGSGAAHPANSDHASNTNEGARSGPRDITFTAAATAGEVEYQILSVHAEDFGTDAVTQTKTLLLRLRLRVTNRGKYPALFTPGGFRLSVDGVPRSPKDSPSKAVDGGASEDGEITFLVPDNAERLVLRVGYSDDARADIPLTFKLNR